MSHHHLSANASAYDPLRQWLNDYDGLLTELAESTESAMPTELTEPPGAVEASDLASERDSIVPWPGPEPPSNEELVCLRRDLAQHPIKDSHFSEHFKQLSLSSHQPQELGQAAGLELYGFQKLPQEVQDMIWWYLQPGPRNIEICAGHHPMSKCECSWCQNGRVVQARDPPLLSHMGEIITRKGEILYDANPVPILMHVNKVTRSNIMSKWQFHRLRGNCRNDPGVLVNFEIDILCLNFRIVRLLPAFFMKHAANITQIAIDLKILPDLMMYHAQTDTYLEQHVLCHLPNLRDIFLILDIQRIAPCVDPFLPCRRYSGSYTAITTQLDDTVGINSGWVGHGEPLLARLMRSAWRMKAIDGERRTWRARTHKAKFTLKILRQEWTDHDTMYSQPPGQLDWYSTSDTIWSDEPL